MPSTWAGVFQESQPYATTPDPAGLLRFGAGIAAKRLHRDEDPLEELVDHIESEVAGLTRGQNLFTDADPELQGSDLRHLPAAFVVVMGRPGQITPADYSIGTTTPTTETVKAWVVAKAREPGPKFEAVKTLLYAALAALRTLQGRARHPRRLPAHPRPCGAPSGSGRTSRRWTGWRTRCCAACGPAGLATLSGRSPCGPSLT